MFTVLFLKNKTQTFYWSLVSFSKSMIQIWTVYAKEDLFLKDKNLILKNWEDILLSWFLNKNTRWHCLFAK